MKNKPKNFKKASYGSVADRQASMPNLVENTIEDNNSDLEEDPVANNCEISYLLDSTENRESTKTKPAIKKSSSKSSYIIEPMAFIQNLAYSIMTISVSQFIYNRIYNRLVSEAIGDNTENYTISNFIYSSHVECNMTVPNQSLVNSYNSFGNFRGDFVQNLLPHQQITKISVLSNFYHPQQQNLLAALTHHLTPDQLNEIRNKAQSQTAHLYFVSALYAAIPIILMTNILGVNCSNLGRKTLLVINLLTLTVRYFIYLLQSFFVDWPDWVFYVGSFIESLSGSSGIFYLALYCYISDLTPPSERSYRITFINNLNSIASLCVTGLCGYFIKYYGYFYLFLTSWLLIIIALIYTIFFIPEPLVELKDVGFWSRLKSCSIRKSANCLKVYFNDDEEYSPNSLLNNQKKQTCVLLLVVFVNFIYVFGTQGIASIFTLYIMNAPYCFDSIEISQFSIFTTVVSLFMCMFVSKFIRINDLLINVFSCGSYFASIFCYVYGNSRFYVYLGSAVASISGLHYGYTRSIVSKSMAKHEVSDALSLIIIVDTFISVVSVIIFPMLYSSIVSQGIDIIFLFSNGFILLALILDFINYFFYKPIVHKTVLTSSVYNEIDNAECLNDENHEEQTDSSTGIINPMMHSWMLRSIETI